MSCLGPNYRPIPQRVWSRVQAPCSVEITTDTTNGNVYVPLTNQTIPQSQYEAEKQMLLKGNVLQYKKNSSNLSKQQRYAQIARGNWTNRTTTWATQTETYTNPNTKNLLRVNSVSIPKPTDIPLNPFDCSGNTIEDGGSLVCNQTTSTCSGVVTNTTFNQPCNFSSASDVPGTPVLLCWTNKLQTWYPRQRYVMPVSGNKFPTNYKLLVSANGIPSQRL